MAEGFMKALGPDAFIVYSVGTEECDSQKSMKLEVIVNVN